MKRLMLIVAVATALLRVNAAEMAWLTDLPKAQAQAKAENKLVLLDFTGSDWCPGCIAFKKDVLDSQKFQTYATTNLVVVELDYPQDKPQPEALKKANAKLQEKYQVEGLPTFVVLDQNGREIGRDVGYDGKGVNPFIAWLEKVKTSK